MNRLQELSLSYLVYYKTSNVLILEQTAQSGIVEAYEAGFNKAKELAVELMRKPAWMAIRDMPHLGEEEVADVR